MPPPDIERLRADIQALRRVGGVRSSDLQSIARRLGRSLSPRGKHPTWVSHILPTAPPLSIPDHGGRDLNRFTAQVILDQLEEDLNALEAQQREVDR
jgi:hypothetical protein